VKNIIAVFCGVLLLILWAGELLAVPPGPPLNRMTPPMPPLPWAVNPQKEMLTLTATNSRPRRRDPLELIRSQIPLPPDSNLWIVLSFSNTALGYTVYQRDSLATNFNWLVTTNISTNVIQFLIDKTVTARFYRVIANNPFQNVTLAWNLSTDPTVIGYNVYYGGASRNYTNTLNAGNVTNTTVKGLRAGTMYYFAATTYNSSGVQSPFSNEVNYSTPTSSIPIYVTATRSPWPPTVISIAATNITSTNATVGGRVVSTGGDLPITMFFYGATDPNTDTNAAWQFLAVAGTSTNTVSCKLTGLTPNTKYYYIFVALNAAGMGWSSPEMSFTTKATLAMSPKGRSLLPTGKAMVRPAKVALTPMKVQAPPPNSFSSLESPTGLRVDGLP
jgi:hypothetical protein